MNFDFSSSLLIFSNSFIPASLPASRYATMRLEAMSSATEIWPRASFQPTTARTTCRCPCSVASSNASLCTGATSGILTSLPLPWAAEKVRDGSSGVAETD